MLAEILWKPMPAAFRAKDASYNLVSLSLLLHAARFPMIELPVSSDTIYLKPGWGQKPATKLRRSYSYIQFMHQPLRPSASFFCEFPKYVLALFSFSALSFQGRSGCLNGKGYSWINACLTTGKKKDAC